MQEPEFDSEDPDTESMFDFLAGEDGDKREHKKAAQPSTKRGMPTIRKPVPVSESGPLLPPKPGAPVEPPPELTGSKAASGDDDMSFLEGAGNSARSASPSRPVRSSSRSSRPSINSSRATSRSPKAANSSQSNASAQSSESARSRESAEPIAPAKRPDTAKQASDNVTRLRTPGKSTNQTVDTLDNQFDDFSLDLNDGEAFDSDWRAGHVNTVEPEFARKRGGYRWIAYGVGLLFVGGGVASFLLADRLGFSNPLARQSDVTIESTAETQLDQGATATDGAPLIVDLQPSPMMMRFKAQLAELEALVQAGSLDEADQVLATMDRTVYGYGVKEFDDVQTKINGIRSGEIVPGASVTAEAEQLQLEQEQLAIQAEAARLEQASAAESAAQEDAARLEQARAAESAAQAEAARLEQARAAESAAQAEAARLEQAKAAELAAQAEAARLEQAKAAELAAQAEAARLEQVKAAELAAQAEAARLEQVKAAELAAQAEAERLAQQSTLTFAARQEQARVAEQAAQTAAARLEQARKAELSVAARAEAGRLATDRRIAEERAALQRQEARQVRLQQARDRELAQGRLESEGRVAVQPTTPEPSTSEPVVIVAPAENQVALTNLPISDEDLQLVYRRFADLQKAIRDRDINTVVSLTQRSGGRVQELLQMFQNSVDIDARIRNVSTNNATGEINGTLEIKKIQRADGSVSIPPPSLASIRLSSEREATGWSAIRW